MGNCIRVNTKKRSDKYLENDEAQELPSKPKPVIKTNAPTQAKKEFSWDRKKKNINLDDFQFKNEDGKFLYKQPDSIKGQMFKLE